ncbi:MAG: hypothetical protein ABI379_13455 [Rhodanobacter sp.]
MLYSKIFKALEQARWNMQTDVPWASFDAGLLSDEQAQSIKMNAITEWSALPATEMFLRDNQHDADFSAFMSIWFYEEQKHSLVLIEYLHRFRPGLVPTEEELQAVRFPFDPAPPMETLMLHFCGELLLTRWYKRAAQWHAEPVIKAIYGLISQDEARHGGAYLKYMKRAIDKHGDVARQAFAKVGMMVVSAARFGKPVHPTNLHVNKALYPNDTVQSRLPDPACLDIWLNQQIQFDKTWEQGVSTMILRNLSQLFGQSLTTASELHAYRKCLGSVAA